MKPLNVNYLRPRVLIHNLRRKKKVNIPEMQNPDLYNKFLALKESLNYMATYYNIDFKFKEFPRDDECLVHCEKGTNVSIARVSNQNDFAELTKLIYSAASNVL